ncbi:MAG TPA: PAS domain S-box protein [Phycisphaerales bacterium]|nr:PAS domain S-box protein [Phycisphaerales bacterium]
MRTPSNHSPDGQLEGAEVCCWPASAFGVGFFALAAFLGAEAGHALSVPDADFPIATIWPPTGLTVAVLLLTRPAVWWRFLTALVVGNFASDVLVHGVRPDVSVAFCLANTLGAAGTAWLARAGSRGAFRFRTVREVVSLLAAGFAASSLGSSVVGALVLSIHFGQTFSAAWMLWWTSDVAGLLTVAPAVLVTLTRGARTVRGGARAELVAALAAVAGACAFTFAAVPAEMNLRYLLFPPMLWVVLRFGLTGAAIASLIIAVAGELSLRATNNAFRPTIFEPGLAVILAQVFIIAVASSFLIVAAVVEERRRAVDELERGNAGLEAQVQARTAALRASEERFRSLVDHLSVGVAVAGEDGVLRAVNPAMRRLVGYTEEELIGKTYAVYTHPDDLGRNLSLTRGYFADPGATGYDIEKRYIRKDGEVRWVRVAARSFADPSSGERLVLGVAEDVTERKRAEEALRASERLNRAMLDALPAEIALLDASGRITAVNRPWSRFAEVNGPADAASVGVGADYVAMCEQAAANGDADAEAALAGIRSVLSGEREGFSSEYACHAPGAERWFLMQVVRAEGAGAIVAHSEITERKRAERALRESEERLNAVLASIDDHLVCYDRGWRFTYVNEGAARTLGRSAAELLGKCIWELFPDAVGNQYYDEVHLAARERRVVRSEFYYTPFDAWFENHIYPTSNGVTVFSANITERKRGEAALKAAHDTLRQLVERSPFGVYVVDADFRLSLVGDGAQRIFSGVRPLIGRDFAEVLRCVWEEPFASEAVALFRRTLETGEPYRASRTTERRSGSGDFESYDWKIERVALPDGRFGVVCHFYDLSERQQFEAALRESERRFSDMANTAPAMLLVTDHEHRCTFLSRGWHEFTGQREEEGLGLGWADAAHPDDRERIVRAFLAAAAKREPFAFDFSLRRADGEYRWAIGAGRPRFNPDGSFAGYIGSVIDVHERKLAEEEVRRHRERLEELVAERTRELEETHSRLRLSERMAAIGTLAAGIGHDLGNLLLPVRMRLDSLRDRGLSADLAEDVEAIRKATQYVQRLTSGLRSLALDPEASVASDDRTDLAEWWDEARTLLSTVLPRGVQLTHDIPRGIPPVGLARPALSQAVFNLVQNAGDAIKPRGKGTVRVTVHLEGGGAAVAITVEDDGPGMSEDVKRRCMEPFFTTKTRALSTGLGLALVKGIADRAGGEVRLDSEPGRGTRFTLVLPVAVDACPENVAPVARVCVADPRMRMLVATLLKSMRFEVSDAATPSPEEALLVADTPVDAAAAFVASRANRRAVVLTPAPLGLTDDRIIEIVGPPRVAEMRRAIARLAEELRAEHEAPKA